MRGYASALSISDSQHVMFPDGGLRLFQVSWTDIVDVFATREVIHLDLLLQANVGAKEQDRKLLNPHAHKQSHAKGYG